MMTTVAVQFTSDGYYHTCQLIDGKWFVEDFKTIEIPETLPDDKVLDLLRDLESKNTGAHVVLSKGMMVWGLGARNEDYTEVLIGDEDEPTEHTFEQIIEMIEEARQNFDVFGVHTEGFIISKQVPALQSEVPAIRRAVFEENRSYYIAKDLAFQDGLREYP